MNGTSADTHEETLSRWQRFQQTVVWEYLQVIVVAFVLVFGFIRPFVVEAFKIPSGSMEENPCLLEIASSSASSSMVSTSRERTLSCLTSTNLPEGMYLYLSRLTNEQRTSSNASLPSEVTQLKRRATRSTSMAHQSKTVPIQNMLPAPLVISTIFPHFVSRIICLTATRLPRINSRQISST